MSDSFSAIKQVIGESIHSCATTAFKSCTYYNAASHSLSSCQEKRIMGDELRVFYWAIFLLVNVATCQEEGGDGGRRGLVPAMFIFGDSLIDNGNNNNLPSFAKANYFPYGIDFDGGPTGRFSNGYTMVDEIGKFIYTSYLF